MSQSCCAANACSWFQQNFSLDIQNTKKGLAFNLEPKDETKAKVLQNLMASAQEFCQTFCKKD